MNESQSNEHEMLVLRLRDCAANEAPWYSGDIENAVDVMSKAADAIERLTGLLKRVITPMTLGERVTLETEIGRHFAIAHGASQTALDVSGSKP
jgi:predicted ATPase